MTSIKHKLQRTKKGYCDYDLYNIDGWFINIFPKMLGEFAERTCGYPCNEEELKKEVSKMSTIWVQNQQSIIDKILKKYDKEFDRNNTMCCWLLIILRMKYCFEMCDEWNNHYEPYWENRQYEELNKEVEKYKAEAFYLFEKYFFALWW